MSRELWDEKLSQAALLLGQDVDAAALAQRFGDLDRDQVDALADAASSRVLELGDSRLTMAHFEDAVERVDVTIDAEQDVATDGGPASGERVDDLEARVQELEHELENLEAQVSHVNGKVDRVLTGARAFADALNGGGGRDV